MGIPPPLPHCTIYVMAGSYYIMSCKFHCMSGSYYNILLLHGTSNSVSCVCRVHSMTTVNTTHGHMTPVTDPRQKTCRKFTSKCQRYQMPICSPRWAMQSDCQHPVHIQRQLSTILNYTPRIVSEQVQEAVIAPLYKSSEGLQLLLSLIHI